MIGFASKPNMINYTTEPDDVMTWKRFPHYWSLVWRIRRSPKGPPHKGPIMRIFPFLSVWTSSWTHSQMIWDSKTLMWLHCNMCNGMIKMPEVFVVHVNLYSIWKTLQQELNWQLWRSKSKINRNTLLQQFYNESSPGQNCEYLVSEGFGENFCWKKCRVAGGKSEKKNVVGVTQQHHIFVECDNPGMIPI